MQSQLYTAKQLVSELVGMDSKLSGVLDMLEEAAIQLSEASDELRHYHDRLDLDPNRLFELEQRISRQIALARKHQVMPEELPAVYQAMLEEQRLLDDSAGSLESLSQQVVEHHQLALETARQLHALRQASADELTQLITESMHSLSMPHGVFAIEVAFDERHLTADGADHIEFRVTTNPGQPLQPIAKVASGGELSRIALAIQVITARKMETPALIFDEVDVGISGPTAAVVGKLLRQLGESTQVMCVTHLPQVAGCGHHHFFVCKETDGEMTETHMQPLDKRARLQGWLACWAAARSRATPWQTRKSCLRRKLFDFHRVIVNSKLPADRSRRFPSARRSIIIGILQMSHVLLGPKKESNHYAL